MATGWRAEADEIVTCERRDHRHQFRLCRQPRFVFVAHLVAGSVASDDERVSERRGSAAVAGVRRQRSANVTFVEHARGALRAGNGVAEPL